jgi:hypothetical protein
MKKQIRMGIIFVVTALISFASGATAAPNTFDANGNLCVIGGTSPQDLGTPMELWMGVGNESAGTLVGTVTFDGGNVVRIDLNDPEVIFPYFATAVHIHFADTVENIPHTTTGNPIPGQFEFDEWEYVEVITDPTQTVIEVPVTIEPTDTVGAVHLSLSQYGGLDGYEFLLPKGPVQLNVEMAVTNGNYQSYVQATITEGGFLDGVYDSWCVDVDTMINPVETYLAHVYSTYSDDWLDQQVLGMALEYPENLPKVNYLLNTYAVGDMVTPTNSNCNPVTICGAVAPPEALTMGDIQRAIWALVDDDQDTAGLNSWSQERINAILCDANTNGAEFVPDCGQKIAFIIVPDDGDVQMITGQSLLQEIGIACETEAVGSAWGDGKYGEIFPGSNQWGTYFIYDETCGL